MICDEIQTRKAGITDVRARISKIKNTIQELREKTHYCGNCNDGIIYKPWPEDITRKWGADFVHSMGSIIEKGIPVTCECVGGGKYEEEIHALEESIRDKEIEISEWRTRHEYLKRRVGECVIDKGLRSYNAFGNEDEIEKLKRWIDKGMRKNCILIGKSGSGKSHLACGIANHLICLRRDCYYIDGYALDNLTNLELTSARKRMSIVDRLSTADYLIIDDASKSKMTHALFSHVWFPVMKTRTDNALPTIFTFDTIVRKTWKNAPIDDAQLDALYNRIETVITGRPHAQFVLLKNTININTPKREAYSVHERKDIYG